MATTFITEAEALISVTLGTSKAKFPPSRKTWTTFEGGDPQAATTQVFPGGMQPAVPLPGPVKRTAVTVTIPYGLDIHAQKHTLEKALNGPMSASFTPIDANGNTNGTPTTRTGICKEIQWPKFDAKSGTEAILGVVMECGG